MCAPLVLLVVVATPAGAASDAGVRVAPVTGVVAGMPMSVLWSLESQPLLSLRFCAIVNGTFECETDVSKWFSATSSSGEVELSAPASIDTGSEIVECVGANTCALQATLGLRVDGNGNEMIDAARTAHAPLDYDPAAYAAGDAEPTWYELDVLGSSLQPLPVAATPAPTTPAGEPASLAFTGAEAVTLALLGAVLLAAGAAYSVARRRTVRNDGV